MRAIARDAGAGARLMAMAATVIGLLLAAQVAAADTFHVRRDGGDAAQCSGRVDAPYTAAIRNKACAWSHPFAALPPDDRARMRGGDTLLIAAGDYMMGLGAPDSAVGRCGKEWPWDCFAAAVPSGPDAAHPTRILGVGHDARCTSPPRLWGNERVTKVLNLEGSSNVEVGCLEITDKSDCVEFHVDANVRCRRDTAPYGQWAAIGISAKASRSVWLHDLSIHGLANTGILAGGLTDWTVDRVAIVANGWAGWNGDIGSATSNSGQMRLRHLTIAWNGCGQRWQTGEAFACWAQESGGYGDGLGTGTTGGQWVIEDSYVHHNTSDGIDLLYLDGAPNTSVAIRRVLSVANAGNQIKTRGNALIENSVAVGNCAYFYNRYNMLPGDQCRAVGNTLSLALVNGQTTTVRHNTIIGEGDCLIISTAGNGASRVNLQNNALIGQVDWRANLQGSSGELTCGYYADTAAVVNTITGNDFYNVKANQCPPGNVCGQNPLLTNMSMAAFNPTPLPGSPLIDRAPVITGVGLDYALHFRPDGNGPDIGAVERPSGIPKRTPHGAAKIAALVQRDSAGNVRVDDANGSAYGTSPGSAYRVAATGDYDGDGFADLAWSNGRQMVLATNDHAGGFKQGTPVAFDAAWTVAGSADVDGDGTSDLLWRRGTTLGYWRIDAGKVVGSGAAGNVAAGYRLVDAADLDADGTDDLAWSNGTRLAIWLNDGSGHYRAAWEGRYAGGWQPAALRDVDGDGSADVVWQLGGHVAWWPMDGATPRSALMLVDAGVGARLVGAADTNSDGRTDLIFRSAKTTTRWTSAAQGYSSSVDADSTRWTPGTIAAAVPTARAVRANTR